jgi:hypothetical protein
LDTKNPKEISEVICKRNLSSQDRFQQWALGQNNKGNLGTGDTIDSSTPRNPWQPHVGESLIALHSHTEKVYASGCDGFIKLDFGIPIFHNSRNLIVL